MRITGTKTPFRVSSIPTGTITRPAIYAIIEDIVAVDGHGGQKWREDLNIRYEASPQFRQMLDRLNVFWGFGAVFLALVLTIIVFVTPKTIGYGVGRIKYSLLAVSSLMEYWQHGSCHLSGPLFRQ